MLCPPTVSSLSRRLRCSEPIIGRHGRGSSRTTVPRSTRTSTSAGSSAGSEAATTSSPAGPVTSTSVTVATAYRYTTPGSPVVSAYGPCGTARTSPPWWSSGVPSRTTW